MNTLNRSQKVKHGTLYAFGCMNPALQVIFCCNSNSKSKMMAWSSRYRKTPSLLSLYIEKNAQSNSPEHSSPILFAPIPGRVLDRKENCPLASPVLKAARFNKPSVCVVLKPYFSCFCQRTQLLYFMRGKFS